MFELVIDNLVIVAYAVALLALAMTANTCFGLWYNIKQLKKSFSVKKLKASGIKFLVFTIGLSALSILVTLIPVYIQFSGVDIAPEVYDFANIAIVASIFITSIFAYTKQAIEKLRMILNGSDSNGQ